MTSERRRSRASAFDGFRLAVSTLLLLAVATAASSAAASSSDPANRFSVRLLESTSAAPCQAGMTRGVASEAGSCFGLGPVAVDASDVRQVRLVQFPDATWFVAVDFQRGTNRSWQRFLASHVASKVAFVVRSGVVGTATVTESGGFNGAVLPSATTHQHAKALAREIAGGRPVREQPLTPATTLKLEER